MRPRAPCLVLMALLLLHCSLLVPAGNDMVTPPSPAPSAAWSGSPSLTASARYSDNLTVESVTFPGEVDAFNYSDVLLLINDNSQMSKDVGEYFAAARGVPPERMAYLDVPDQEFITPEQFTDLKGKVKSYMVEHELVNDVNYIVTTKGFPLSVYSPSGFMYGACVDEELALIFSSLESLTGNFWYVSNPYFNQDSYFSHRDYPMYIINRLTGYNWSDVKALIDHANTTYGNRGLFVLDADPNYGFNPGGYGWGNYWLTDARDILLDRANYVSGIEVFYDDSYWYVTGKQDVMGYCSWGSNDANDTDNAKPHNTWVNGSLAETYVSTGGRTFRWPPSYGQSLIADWIREGVTGIKGYVQEPFLDSMAVPDILFERYTRGFNLGECYRMASYQLGWMGVVVGDPKVSAFRDVPDVALDSARVTVSNATPAEGDPLVVRVVVDNLGGRVEGMPVTLYVDDEVWWQGNATFDTFSRTTIAMNLTAPMDEGPHDVSVVLNTFNESEDRLDVFETLGTNNGGSTSIEVRKRPIIELHAEPASALTQESLQFTINVTNTTRSITGFYFDFGDGTPLMDWNVPVIMHSFLDDGVYTVRARVIDTGPVLSLWSSVDVTIMNRAPVATITVSPGEALTGDGMDFNASRSTDADGIVASVHWDLGDGNVSDAWIVPHAYRFPGEYVVALTVTDNDGATTTATRRVVALNRPPVAAFALDGQVARKGHQSRLDASASADPDGRIVQYEWDFGDGTVGEESRSPWVVHVFPHAGMKNVMLGVIDDMGARGRVTLAVEVTNELPVAGLVLSREVVLTGNSVGLDASLSQDTDGTVVWYEFTVSSGTGQPVVVYSGDAPTAEYVPTGDGRYTVTVTVRDDDGGLANRTATLDVLDRPPLAFLDAATTALDGKVLTAPASVPVAVEATDPDGVIRTIEVLINGEPFAEQNGSGSYTSTVLFSKEAHVALSVVVVDDDGSSVTLGVNFTVNEVPRARFAVTVDGRPATAADTRTGVAMTFDATNSSDAAGSQLTYVWDLGDGPRLEGLVVNHAYLLAGTYTVTLTVKDAYGAQGVARLDIVVAKASVQDVTGVDWLLVAWIVGLLVVAAVLVGLVVLRSRRGGGDAGKGEA